MYLVVKQQLNHLSKVEYNVLKEQCRISKNLKNQVLYEIRQKFFSDKSYLNYNEVYKLLKTSNNYKLLQSNMAQQINVRNGKFQMPYSTDLCKDSLTSISGGGIARHKLGVRYVLGEENPKLTA